MEKFARLGEHPGCFYRFQSCAPTDVSSNSTFVTVVETAAQAACHRKCSADAGGQTCEIENAKELPNLISGQSIRMKPSPSDYSKKWRCGTCVSEVGTRLYVVDVYGKQYRGNRRDLRSTKEPTDSNADLDTITLPSDDSPLSTPEVPKKSETPVNQSENQQKSVKKSNVSASAPKSSTSVKSTRYRKVCLPSKYNDFVVDLK